jgi:hypothetical protein
MVGQSGIPFLWENADGRPSAGLRRSVGRSDSRSRDRCPRGRGTPGGGRRKTLALSAPGTRNTSTIERRRGTSRAGGSVARPTRISRQPTAAPLITTGSASRGRSPLSPTPRSARSRATNSANRCLSSASASLPSCCARAPSPPTELGAAPTASSPVTELGAGATTSPPAEPGAGSPNSGGNRRFVPLRARMRRVRTARS